MSIGSCRACGRVHEAHKSRPGAMPKPGDVSICWGCGAIALFTEDGLRPPTAEESAEIEADPEMVRLRAALRTAPTPSLAADVVWGSS